MTDFMAIGIGALLSLSIAGLIQLFGKLGDHSR